MTLQVDLRWLGLEQSVGLGTLIARALTWVGFAKCSACARRAAELDELVVFVGRDG